MAVPPPSGSQECAPEPGQDKREGAAPRPGLGRRRPKQLERRNVKVETPASDTHMLRSKARAVDSFSFNSPARPMPKSPSRSTWIAGPGIICMLAKNHLEECCSDIHTLPRRSEPDAVWAPIPAQILRARGVITPFIGWRGGQAEAEIGPKYFEDSE